MTITDQTASGRLRSTQPGLRLTAVVAVHVRAMASCWSSRIGLLGVSGGGVRSAAPRCVARPATAPRPVDNWSQKMETHYAHLRSAPSCDHALEPRRGPPRTMLLGFVKGELLSWELVVDLAGDEAL